MRQAQTGEGATVVPFRPRLDPTAVLPPDDRAERGTILLFTGVRYQRMDDDDWDRSWPRWDEDRTESA